MSKISIEAYRMETTYKVEDLLKGISNKKQTAIKQSLKRSGIDCDTYIFKNPFTILEFKDEYGNDILTLNDISENCYIENFEQVDSFLCYVIDGYFNENANASYYNMSQYWDMLFNKQVMLKDNQYAKVGNYILFKGTTEEDKFNTLEELYKKDTLVYDKEKRIVFNALNYYRENQIMDTIIKLKQANNTITDIDFSETGLDEDQIGSMNSILKAEANIGMILAPAGTGKTRTILETVNAISSVHSDWSIAVLAPTGKAASNLQADFSDNVTVETIHAYIGWKNQIDDADINDKIKNTKIIILDEASMISYDVLYHLLRKIDVETTKVIIIGDEYQLCAVNTGNLINDCKVLGVKYHSLSKDYRTQTDKLTRNHDYIRNVFKDKSFIKENETFYGLDVNEHFHIYEYSSYRNFVKDNYDSKNTESVVITHRNKLKDEINDLVRNAKMNDEQPLYGDYYKGDKIIINENKRIDNSYYLTNGDTGIILDKGVSDNGDAYLLIKLYPGTDKEVEKKVYYSEIDNDMISHADCITVNKSQGSQWNDVTILIPEDNDISINLFYTAISRARNNVNLFIDKDTLKKILLQRPENKKTLIKYIYETIDRMSDEREPA